MAPLSKLIGGKPARQVAAQDDAQTARRERRKEARPGELLDAALDLFVEKGFAATRSEEVAARAGVSKGTLFLYFPTKEELFKAVVRENISGRFAEWNQEFEDFEGTAADMVRYCMRVWWERIGATRASGITKLMISEARNFPELAAFYQQEVIRPGTELIRRILQRGIDNGEFRALDLDYAVFSIVAPMIFLLMMKHSLGACAPQDYALDPERYVERQADTLLQGLCVRPGEGSPS
ncbi:MAG TPA: TetR/AcrR family transcriptional regulator [Ramlibacter sp.]|jgi:AcrR family transcriptional regulator|uniref:TetR/AcrR family transcriptional regulator n=1 Tax=Ramlibacter sp. TaxID=1917967 RepID=UPI002D6044F9|nr:TetR/AcrR family transcriptional regulator [Ramlibacter sp.]HZY20199.1 TetR/AcrR family transcriptional regulator [Ramlibacter sp.]